ncbi:MAG: succinate dehydrogenase cytochrome b subunit [Acidimicrobiia bacterium]|nr:MAG: succinate dehydrogenase cytochrome b subunit [Acidimicrobiia bacterium]
MTTTNKRGQVDRRTGWKEWLSPFFTSDLGIKWLMGLTGVGLLGYVLVHMVGNLKVFFGAEEINLYAASLRELLYPLVPNQSILWLFRIGLTAMFVFHIWAAWVLTNRSHKARGDIKYQAKRQYDAVNYASRTMRWGGVIILLFLIFHLADLTLGYANPEFIYADVYHNIVTSFERVPVAVFYIVAQVALAMHIYHGAWSLFQSLGLANPRFNDWRRWFAVVFAVVILIGNTAMVLAVQVGILTL